MKILKFRTPFFFILILLSVKSFSQTGSQECIFEAADKYLVEQKLAAFSEKADLPIADLLVKIGLSFLETPYVVASLENGTEEKLVINLQGLDCTTFVESCLALARTVKLGRSDFDSYAGELVRIRYRDGIRNGYPSRLHYFSEWISDNSEKNLVSDKPNKTGMKLLKTINFMSTHPESYPVLKANPKLIPEIAKNEATISNSGYYFFPKTMQSELLLALQHGDIVALTSEIAGVDINHIGIIVLKNNQFHLLHAPLSGKKVLISEGSITDFIQVNSKNSGIAIARPVFLSTTK